MSPISALTQALDELDAHDDFARLPGLARLLVSEAILAFGREALLHGDGAAEQAGRVAAAMTRCPRLGDAAAKAVTRWVRPLR